MKFTTEIKFSYEDFENLLISALEGGSNYWCIARPKTPSAEALRIFEKIERSDECDEGMKGLAMSELIARYVWAGGRVEFQGAENTGYVEYDNESSVWEFDLDGVMRGFKLMQETQPRHWSDFKRDNADADTADVWFQLALMGEITFG